MKNKFLFMFAFMAFILSLTAGTAFAAATGKIIVENTDISTDKFMTEEEAKHVDSPVDISVIAENYTSIRYYISDSYFSQSEITDYIADEDWIEYKGTISCSGFGFKQIIIAIEGETATDFYSLTLNLTSPFGELVYRNDIPHFIAEDGTTTVMIEEDGLIWLKEENEGLSAWYGLDNVGGLLDSGSHFHVRGLSNNLDIWKDYINWLDDSLKKNIDTDKSKIFLADVTSPEGKKVTGLDKPVKFYVQIDEDWNKDHIEVAYISKDKDEEFTEQIKEIDGNQFVVIDLPHFSPFIIYDRLSEEERPKEDTAGTSPKTMDIGAVKVICHNINRIF